MFFDTPTQIEKDAKFINDELRPSVIFIKEFKATHKRLPTNREYYTWRRNNYQDYTSDISQTYDSLISPEGSYIRNSKNIVVGEYGIIDSTLLRNVDWSKDYAIGVWRGEWNEYYFSWTDKYYGNNYSWKEGFIGLSRAMGIATIPFIIWWFTFRSRRSST